MSLFTVISYGTCKIVRFPVHVPDDGTTARTHIVLTCGASGPVLHVVRSGLTGENLINPLMIRVSVLRMNLILPDIPGAVHVLGRKSIPFHGISGPA